LNANQSILVQVVKEPISTKDQELAELSLGRFIVLVPFSDRYFSKIEDKRKERLKKLYNPSNQKDLVLLFAQ
jgi:ribonuclease G